MIPPIAQNIRLRRQRLGWTQAELGARCAPLIRQPRVSSIELGLQPTRDELQRIATALGVTVADLQRKVRTPLLRDLPEVRHALATE